MEQNQQTLTPVMPDANYKEQLFESFSGSLPKDFTRNADFNIQVMEAYDFAYEAHYGVFRKGGNHEPYITHPVSVALIVANEMGLGKSAVIPALLHDVIEDTKYTYEDLRKMFGKNVAETVLGLTNFTDHSRTFNPDVSAQAETLSHVILSIVKNPIVAYIKIADRLHNMRTISDMKSEMKRRKASENLYVYVDVADQLGLYDIKNELENLSFECYYPNMYAEIKQKSDDAKEQQVRLIKEFENEVSGLLDKTGRRYKFSIVEKSLYQISLIMQRNDCPFESVDNCRTLRIIFETLPKETEEEFYKVCCGIHKSIIERYPEKRGSFIRHSKHNGFKAVVFTIDFNGGRIELQLMTVRDDLAAHKGYYPDSGKRIGLESLKKEFKNYTGRSSIDVLTHFRNIIADRSVQPVFVYTEDGGVVELPKDSCVLDFAYTVSKKTGNHCLGAEVNGKTVPCNYVLTNFDEVKILVSPSVRPQYRWRECIKSMYAKECLDYYFKHNFKHDNSDAKNGERKFNAILHARKIILPSEKKLARLYSLYNAASENEFYARIARNEIDTNSLLFNIQKIRNEFALLKQNSGGDGSPAAAEKKEVNPGVVIDSKKPLQLTKDMSFSLCSECCPLCGDDAVVFMGSNRTLFVHRPECNQMKDRLALYGKTVAKVLWPDDMEPALTKIKIEGAGRQNLIRDLGATLSDLGVNIKTLNINEENGVFNGTLAVMVRDLAEYEKVKAALLSVQNVAIAKRFFTQDGTNFFI